MSELRDGPRCTPTGSRATARVATATPGNRPPRDAACGRRHSREATAVAPTRHRLTESDDVRYRHRLRTLFIVLPERAASTLRAGLGQLRVQRLQRVERRAQLVAGLGAEPRAQGPDRGQVTEHVAYRHEALQVFERQTGPGGLDDGQVRVEVDVG